MSVQKNKPATKTESKTSNVKPKDLSAKKEEITEELDDLIDKIDEVLEENAAEFVANYIQRGGE